MSMQDLYSALNMFKDGASDLALQRAVSGANDAVQQVKASGASQMEQRGQLQDISNQLVTHLAGTGTPATTLQALQGAIAGPRFSNSNEMYGYGLQRGDQQTMDAAHQWQAEEQNPQYKMALLQAKTMAGMNGITGMRLANEMDQYNDTQLNKLGDAINVAKASSRTPFGQWATVDGKGERLQQLLGSPDQWKNMTGTQLSLVAEGLGAQVKGGVLTKEESEQIMPQLYKLQAAAAKSKITGNPAPVDLSGYAQLFNQLSGRESDLANQKMLDGVLTTLNTHSDLAFRPAIKGRPSPGDQFKLTAAQALGQLGVQVDPNNIQIDPKKGVVIPEIQGALEAANQAPQMIKQARQFMNSGDPAQVAKANDFYAQYGISPTTSPSDAAKIVQRRIKGSIFK